MKRSGRSLDQGDDGRDFSSRSTSRPSWLRTQLFLTFQLDPVFELGSAGDGDEEADEGEDGKEESESSNFISRAGTSLLSSNMAMFRPMQVRLPAPKVRMFASRNFCLSSSISFSLVFVVDDFGLDLGGEEEEDEEEELGSEMGVGVEEEENIHLEGLNSFASSPKIEEWRWRT